MTLRCGCENEADDIVFGATHRCTAPPEGQYAANLSAELKRLEREDPDVRAASAALDAVYDRLVPSWRFVVPEYDPAERPFETTLDPDERGDR